MSVFKSLSVRYLIMADLGNNQQSVNEKRCEENGLRDIYGKVEAGKQELVLQSGFRSVLRVAFYSFLPFSLSVSTRISISLSKL